jgi:hypothetical protein
VQTEAKTAAVNGLRFHVSNRQTASLFKLGGSEVAAAFIHAGAQRVG